MEETIERPQLKLRPLQEDTLAKLREAFAQGHRSVLLYGPTGFGKTEMAIALMQAADAKYNRSAMILDRIVLCDQTSKRLDKYSIAHGVLQAGHWRFRPMERIQVCSAQTVEKRGTFPDLKLLIVDECHTQRKATTEFIRKNPGFLVVGLSASPFTEGLAETYDAVVSATTTKQLVDEGWLAPLRVFIAKQVDMKGAKKLGGEYAVDDAAERTMKITGDVVASWIAKTTEVFGGPVKTIVFCTNVAHGAQLAQEFAAHGFNFVPISYKDTDEFKTEAVKDFSKPDTKIHGLIACDILTKGFDVADVMCGVSARPFQKSFSSHVQQMGRVMRAHPGKEFALWLDHSGNYLRFRDDWDEVYEEGVTELSSGKDQVHKDPTEKEKKAAECPRCHRLWPRLSNTCAGCGYTKPMVNTVEIVKGELEELTHDGKSSKADKQSFYSQLLSIQRSRGHAPGWIGHKYREKFGVWPKNMQDIPMTPSKEVLNWEHSRRIAWAKANPR